LSGNPQNFKILDIFPNIYESVETAKIPQYRKDSFDILLILTWHAIIALKT